MAAILGTKSQYDATEKRYGRGNYCKISLADVYISDICDMNIPPPIFLCLEVFCDNYRQVNSLDKHLTKSTDSNHYIFVFNLKLPCFVLSRLNNDYVNCGFIWFIYKYFATRLYWYRGYRISILLTNYTVKNTLLRIPDDVRTKPFTSFFERTTFNRLQNITLRHTLFKYDKDWMSCV